MGSLAQNLLSPHHNRSLMRNGAAGIRHTDIMARLTETEKTRDEIVDHLFASYAIEHLALWNFVELYIRPNARKIHSCTSAPFVDSKSVAIFGGDAGFAETVRRDELKNEFCKNKGIRLLRIQHNADVANEVKDFIRGL